jgi:hypothetical protein
MPGLRTNQSEGQEFYVGFLGFEVKWELRFAENMPLDMEVRRGNLTLHLS